MEYILLNLTVYCYGYLPNEISLIELITRVSLTKIH